MIKGNESAKNLIKIFLRKPGTMYDLIDERNFFTVIELMILKKSAEDLEAFITAEIIENYIHEKLKTEHAN